MLPNANFPWHKAYLAAFRETDPAPLSIRISEAMSALEQRQFSPLSNKEERVVLRQAQIAMRLVQPNTRAEIQKLISTDERFTSFSDACTWPDHPRQRASEHFVNLPRDSDGLHAEACPGASACVVTAIKKDFEVLSSASASQAQKLASLKFLGHWVGDIHQPLHVSFEDDRGGNSVLVTGLCDANLHSAWDALCSRQ